MSTTPHPTKTEDANKVKDSLYGAVKEEVTFEANQIQGTGKAVDPNHSDVLVQKHVAGISISLFVLIAIVLLAAIGGIALYTHTHKGPATPQHVGTLRQLSVQSQPAWRAHRMHSRSGDDLGLVRADNLWVR